MSRGVTALIAGLHLRWDGVWQRPHHLLSRFVRHVPVVVVEEPFAAGEDRDEIFRDGPVTIVRPLRRDPRASGFVDARAIATARTLAGEESPAVWLYQPMMLALADAFPGAPLVYDCMDDLASFAFAPPGMREREQALMERAGVVFCGGPTLYDRRRDRARNVQLFTSGVEFERFAAAREAAPHALVADVPAPRYGYLGVVDERLDLDLIRALVDAPEAPNVFLIGPVVKIDPAGLPRRPNLHCTGFMPYASLPSILAGLNVALMPFAHNESTRSISPTKTLEYLAAGVPVVSTGIADVVRDYSGIVALGEGDAFVAACRAPRDPQRIARGIERAREHGWDAIAEAMWAEVSSLAAPRSVT